MNPLISLKNVSKSYARYDSNLDRVKELLHPARKKFSTNIPILDDINLEINRNEVIGIIGKNGAGKSTLLKIIAGIIFPNSGDVKVNGKVSALIELGASFNPEYTGRENIYFYCMTQGLTRNEVDNIYNDIVGFADIGDYISQPVKTYSSGMFARLAFSASINLNPDLLIVDERLSVGDVFFQQKCMRKMKELIKNGSTVIFVSHDMHAVKFFCDRIIFIQNGKIVEDGYNTIEILDRYEKGTVAENSGYDITKSDDDFIKITDTFFTDKNGIKKNRFRVNEDIIVVINFTILRTEKDRFLGFGIRNQDSVYVMGINTKLDGIILPEEPGDYQGKIYFKNINLYKAVFNCWSVIYNDSGTILESKYLIKDAFEIYDTSELSEGVVVLDREWEIKKV